MRGREIFFGKGLDRGINKSTVVIRQAFDWHCFKTFEEVGNSSQIQIQPSPRQVKPDLPIDDSAHSEMFPFGSKKILKTNSDE